MADEKEFVIIVKAKDLVKHTFKMATAKSVELQYILDREEKSNKKVEGQSHYRV